ncbi:unnamed protein product [Oppiella nova]|uniref:NADPH-dependent diflavin oxidoreductase 1 n=1 Tax=Oppiella nova TaxID=334625 RepID=A0A7R9QBK3_9ACAR|nr:unnamed protein product [Oppiella nova]CAG2162563.1 unnamed protein product [Oppiella nova]
MDLMILYGSETGNSEELAKRIGRQAIDRSIRVRVMACDEYNVSQLIDEKIVLLIVSTTGVGEEPNNMKNFWNFIRRRDLPNDSLCSVFVSVIGFGDSSYERFNFVAKKLHKRVLALGAKPFMDLVLGDEQHDCGPNAVIDPWLQVFWSRVCELLSLSPDLSQIQDSDQLFSPSFKVNFVDKKWEQSYKNNFQEMHQTVQHFHKHNPYLAKVLSNERITSEDHFQDVRHIKLEVNDTKLSYGLGDVCCIKPQNSDLNINRFLSLLNLNKDMYFTLEKNEHNWLSESSYYNNLPKPCSVLTLVTEYMDIQSIPKPSFFDLFYRFSDNDLEKEKLKQFAQNSTSDDLYEYCNRPKRNILEVLTDFPHTTARITFQYLFDLIPAINPRYFSIASSMNVYPNELHLLVAVVHYKTRLKDPRLGLCSNWLANQLPSKNSNVPIYIKKGTFRLAPDSAPIIMIGPGTGVAPFRAFIGDRALKKISNNFLFFGCRYRKSDFYFEEEWKRFNENGFLDFFSAFSRDSDQKVYVQNILWQQKDLVFELIHHKNALVYVSGNAKQMPKQVRETICDIFKDRMGGQPDSKETELLVNRLELRGRIQYECWS